jgi:hypothetical protein
MLVKGFVRVSSGFRLFVSRGREAAEAGCW